MDETARLATYKRLLLEWNQKVNLIGPDAVRTIDAHIAEALEAAEILRPAGEVIDFGSGGGLPAIPMAIVSPEARFQMVEGDQKKWSFLKFAARECGLNCQVHGDRLQRLVPKLSPEIRFSLVTSRAVGHPEQWIPLLRPFLGNEGRVALLQGAESVNVPGFEETQRIKLSRGNENFLVVLQLRST